MTITGIKCPRCKKVIWPKAADIPYFCPCGYCCIQLDIQGTSYKLFMKYGIPGAKLAEVPTSVRVNLNTGEILE